MFGTILDLFIFDIFGDDSGGGVENFEHGADMDSEIDEDDEVGALILLFFLGGQDIDEPYTDLASILTLVQFLDYFESEIEEDAW